MLIQKILVRVCPREIHNLLISPVSKGGFAGARDSDGKVLISLTTLRRNWPNWIVPLTKRYKDMCMCVLCGIPNGLVYAIFLVRKKTIARLNQTISNMPDGVVKERKKEEVKKYHAEVIGNDEDHAKRTSTMSCAIMCPPITINGVSIHRFACSVGKCPHCPKYKPHPREAICEDEIKFYLMDSIRRCSWHGDGCLQQVEGQWCCIRCDAMTKEEKAKVRKKPARIGNKKFRTLHRKTVKEFVKEGGVLHENLRKYNRHRFHRVFLGQEVGLKMARQYVDNHPQEAICTNRDHSDKYVAPDADGEFQLEHFGKDAAVSMEGCAVNYCLPCNTPVLNFYSHLSEEKRQDAGTVAYNIREMLFDLFKRKELKLGTFRILVSIVDGCAVQYRSGSVCYQLCCLAKEFNIVYDRIVQAAGHGKCVVDSQNGLDKTLLDLFFNCLVAHPEELEKDMKRVLTHTRDCSDGESGVLASLAKTCYDILNDPDRTQGTKSHADRAKHRKINERRYFLRLIGLADKAGVKFVCKGFEKGEGEGLGSHYNLRADPELLNDGQIRLAARRFLCYCHGCLEKLKEPIATRYTGASNTCIYYDIFKGANDWKIIDIVENPKGFNADDAQESKANVLQTIGWRMKEDVKVGGYGAYPCDDERYDYYVVKWLELPHQAEKDKIIKIGTDEFPVKKDDWICRAQWMDLLTDTTCWWIETEYECVVRMQSVVAADLLMAKNSPSNRLHGSVCPASKEYARVHGAWKIAKEDHDFMMEEAQSREAFEFESIFDTTHIDDDEEEEKEEEDEEQFA